MRTSRVKTYEVTPQKSEEVQRVMAKKENELAEGTAAMKICE